MGFALFLILLATVFTLGVIVYRTLKSDESADIYAGVSGTTASTAGNPSENSESSGVSERTESSALTVILIRPNAASASSALEAASTNSYGASNLMDGDLATAWSEDKDGPGVGEWVNLEFSEPVVPDHIEIANGYQKDDDRFLGNARIESLEIEYSNGTTQLVDLLDIKDFQSVNAATRQPIEWIKLTIVSIYSDYEWEDASLSEVRVYGQTD